MSKLRLTLPMLLLLAVPAIGEVEHATTREQCRADADAWGIPQWTVLIQHQQEFAQFTNHSLRDPSVTAKTLSERSAEFSECEKTDSGQSGRYAQAIRAYSLAQLARMADFMQRHNLKEQFYQEDDRGKR